MVRARYLEEVGQLIDLIDLFVPVLRTGKVEVGCEVDVVLPV